jgi:hypothetical protein
VSEHIQNYNTFSRDYWRDRALKAEADLERVVDYLDSANERIAQLERKRDEYIELREDGLTGRTYHRP